MLKKEKNYDFRKRMSVIHEENIRNVALKPAEDEIEIEICSRRQQRDEKAWVSFDGDTVEELSVGDRFIISKAVNHTKICKLNKKSFLEILRKKMETYT